MGKIRICIAARSLGDCVAATRAWLPGVRFHSTGLFFLHRFISALRAVPLVLLSCILALPVLALLASWLPWGSADAPAAAILAEMSATVLPRYIWTTLWLGLWVAVGAAVVGATTAAAVTLFEFPGRRLFEWLLLLPLAMPAYVTAYAYTDFLQYSGPLQVGLRASFGLEGRVFPEVRSLGGAVLAFELSQRLGLCSQEAPSRVRAHLRALGMKVDLGDISGDLPPPEALLALMRQDKKVIDGRLRFILARGIGAAFVAEDVPEAAVLSVLQDAMAGR